jgi:FdrA protein
MSWHVRVIPNRYADSVRLMAVARDVRTSDGVQACEIGIGTPANLELLERLGARADATPSDLVIAVDTADGDGDDALDAAERAVEAAVAPSGGADGASAAPAPRTVPAAAGQLNGANLALISVPGEFAALAAQQALTRGMHTFLFSDHVTVEQEVLLKRRGVERGLLVMGPGCGTAQLGDVALGFMNTVRRGPVGVVAAAGTGAQEVACLLDAAGTGVSHIIGVGGRDLSADVGGIMFRHAIRLLAEDDQTETLLLVSKPPAQEVVAALADVIPADKRVIAAFVGASDDLEAPFELHATLEGGAYAAAGMKPPGVEELEAAVDDRRGDGAGRSVVGLFSGGSLAHEATTILEDAFGPVGGNVGHGDGDGDAGHRVLDLGEEEYTQGRPHPMVSLDLRVELLEDLIEDDGVGCVLLDVVLGRASHDDPASGLAPALGRLAERVVVVAHVCGTRADRQDSRRQEQVLRDAGVLVAPTNAAAARLAVRAVTETSA